MLFTLWCIALSFVSLALVGIPVRWLIGGKKAPFDEQAWIQVPFLGIAAIIIVLQNLIYFDLPLQRTVPYFWVGVTLLWSFLLIRGSAVHILRSVPRSVIVGVLLVYGIQSIGLFRLGARDYVGRAWTDQYNYISIAQFLIEKPYSMTISGIDNQPYLAEAIMKKDDRIGQSVLHGFVSFSALSDAKPLFEPVIILSPALIALAIYALCRRLGMSRKLALLAGVGSGLMPAVTMVHLESFQSQALFMPFLLALPLLLHDLIQAPDWRRLAVAAFVFTAATSIYTELWIVLVALILLHLLVCCVRDRQPSRLIGYGIALLVAPFALIPLFSGGIFVILQRVARPVLQTLYPWAFQLEGISRLWIGDLADTTIGLPRIVVLFFGIVPIAMAYAGSIWAAARAARAAFRGWRSRELRGLLALQLDLFALLGLPIVLFIQGRNNPYQFYKLLLSISPLFIVGIMLLYQQLRGDQYRHENRDSGSSIFGALVITLFSAVVICGSGSTAYMALLSSYPNVGPREFQGLLLNQGMRELRAQLEGLHGQTLLLTEPSGYLNGWVAYFGRNNHIWLTNPMVSDIDLSQERGASATINLERLPSDAIVVSNRTQHLEAVSSTNVIWSGSAYSLWKLQRATGSGIVSIANTNGLERVGGDDFFWMGTDETTLRIFAPRDGMLQLQAIFVPGPSLAATQERHVLIRRNQNYQKKLTVASEQATIALPVVQGVNTITIHVLDRPDTLHLPNGETRSLLLGVRRLTASMTDSAVVIERLKNPYGVEQTHPPMFWMGEQPTEIVVTAASAGQLVLKGQFVMGLSVSNQQQRQLLVESDHGYRQVLAIVPGPHSLTLLVPAGQTVIKLTALDRPELTVLPNGDTRKLVLGIADLSITLVS